ncbi:hypothetical protein FOZ61_003858 [Perkinsus olseni]|uniref:Uncharacterized protein n=1 Tax=Perkinsus olseni TaxID=32597 RepID=A0A7J6LNA4_PEROL|nr:hypothetical protein FOZ61_003858 [Perkinsus olseni]
MRPTARDPSVRAAAAGAVERGYADDNDIQQQQHWEAKMKVHAKSLVAILVGDGTVPASQELTEAGVWYCGLCEIFLSNLTSVEVQRRRILDHILLDRRHFSLVQYCSSSLPPASTQQPHPTTNPLQQDYPLMPSGPSTFYLRLDHYTGDIDIIDSSSARPPRHQEDASWYRTNTREQSSSLRRHIGLTQSSSIDTVDESPRDRSSNGVFATAGEPSTHKWGSAGEPSTHKWVGGSSSENMSSPNNIASSTKKAHDSHRGLSKAPLVLLQQEIDAIPLPPSRQPPPPVDQTPMSSSSTSADGNATAGGSTTPVSEGSAPESDAAQYLELIDRAISICGVLSPEDYHSFLGHS